MGQREVEVRALCGGGDLRDRGEGQGRDIVKVAVAVVQRGVLRHQVLHAKSRVRGAGALGGRGAVLLLRLGGGRVQGGERSLGAWAPAMQKKKTHMSKKKITHEKQASHRRTETSGSECFWCCWPLASPFSARSYTEKGTASGEYLEDEDDDSGRDTLDGS